MPQQSAPPSAQVTAAEISRIAGVTRATVSNWRRRHADFPAPSGGTEASPLYDLTAVQEWLHERGHTSTASPAEDLRTSLRLLGAGAASARFFPLLTIAAQLTDQDTDRLAALPDDQLAAAAAKALSAKPTAARNVQAIHYEAGDAAVIRALLACVREAGAQTALHVLAERELDENAKAGGTYKTPEGLADLMAQLLPEGTARVLDPACGSGTLLAAAARHCARELYGQDVLPLQAERTAVGLALADPELFNEGKVVISAGDSLREDAFPGLTVDAVLCNPPFGDRDWGHDELAYDPRWAYGVPPRFESELAWVQHALAHVEPGGYVAMLLPPALAFRTSGRRIRAELVRSGALRAVVSLPARVAYPLHIALQIWVLQRPEPGAPERTSVLFIDGDSETGEGPGAVTRGGSRARAGFDWTGLTARVVEPWTAFRTQLDAFTDEPGLARAVPVVELLDDVVDLTPGRQVRAAAADIDPAALARQVATLRGQLADQIGELNAMSSEGEWEPAGASAREWRSATVADLSRGGALTLLRAAAPGGRDSKGGSAVAEERPVLTARDVAEGNEASGVGGDVHPDTTQTIAEGDVLVRAISGSGPMTRVADETDAGALLGSALHLLRPDPARLDSWFLAGFLGAADNLSAASTGTSTVQINPGRLRVPLMPLAEQRRYGRAFRRAYELRLAAKRTAALAAKAAGTVTAGLTSGALLPPAGDQSG